MRPPPSTSASSPRRPALSSRSAYALSTSPFSSASIDATRPPSKRTSSRARSCRTAREASSPGRRPRPAPDPGVVKTSSVGRLARCGEPPGRCHAAAHPVRAWQEADTQVGAGPLQVDGVEPALVERAAGPLQLVDPLSTRRPPDRRCRAGRRSRSRPTAGRAQRPARGQGAPSVAQPGGRARARSTSCCGPPSCSRSPASRPGGRSRPIRAGSIPSSSPGATGPQSAIVRALLGAVLTHASRRSTPARSRAPRRPRAPAAPAGRRDRGRPCRRTPPPPRYTSSTIFAGERLLPDRAAIRITRCPGWTLAPNPTASSANLSSVAESTAGS